MRQCHGVYRHRTGAKVYAVPQGGRDNHILGEHGRSRRSSTTTPRVLRNRSEGGNGKRQGKIHLRIGGS